MLFTSKTIALIAAAATLTRAAPTTDVAQIENTGIDSTNATMGLLGSQVNEGWATFCDDADCSVNCGTSVSLTNPGCLLEPSRKSVKFHGRAVWNSFDLIVSPDTECSCQNNCHAGISAESNCLSLENLKGGSYRFITGDGLCHEENYNC